MRAISLPQGHDAEHVYDIGMATAPDGEIWHYAARNAAVLVTKDDDFVALKAMRRDGPSVVWIRLGNTTKRALLAHMNRSFEQVISLLEKGEEVVEVG